ncbi:MAG: hypothetical protein FJ100_06990 [Deltaproteobacteria bacterium]|nr:hypothetical protein [Deltaproteobacteria bacterium]
MSLADELHAHAASLRSARRPADVFGPLDGADLDARLEVLGASFRSWAAKVHPDRYVHSVDLTETATEAFQMLNAWRDLAERHLRRSARHGGQAVHVGRRDYGVVRDLPGGDLCDLFAVVDEDGSADDELVLKVTRDPAHNDLLDNEARVLNHLWSRPQEQVEVFCRYVPRLRGALDLDDGRRANLLSIAADHVTLADVQRAYPKGVEGRTVAWMGNRVFEFLAWLHRQGVVHGAVLADHVLIHPVTHGAVIVDWCYAVRDWRYPDGPHLGALPTAQKNRYPQEVFRREAASPRLDLYLAAGTLLQTAGVDLWTGKRPTDLGDPLATPIPEGMTEILRGCRLERPAERFADAFEVWERWKMAQRRAYGPRKFHPFAMPSV